MRLRLMYFMIAVGLLLLNATAALAKGPPDKVTIQGPGIAEAIEITDPQTLNAFSFFQFEAVDENNRRGIDEPPNIGEGYLVTRYIERMDGSVRPWDELHYYLTSDGERDYIFLDGLIGDSSTEFDGRWYHASPEGQQVMRQVLADSGVAQLAPQTLPAAGYDSWPGWRLLLVVSGSLVIAGWLFRQKSDRPRGV
jgi:hypothetical protein